jgi:hypothetical protein
MGGKDSDDECVSLSSDTHREKRKKESSPRIVPLLCSTQQVQVKSEHPHFSKLRRPDAGLSLTV